MGFGLYTSKYENNKQIFHAPISRYIYYAVAGTDRLGMDATNNVHDEISVKLRRRCA